METTKEIKWASKIGEQIIKKVEINIGNNYTVIENIGNGVYKETVYNKNKHVKTEYTKK